MASGERGEVLVSGLNVMRGYWGRPEATAAVLAGGWLCSGDMGTVDADGYVTVVDRIKDMIISGRGRTSTRPGWRMRCSVTPRWRIAKVIGVLDARWGEVGRAVVLLRPRAVVSEAGLLGCLDGRRTRYKIPKSVRFAAALPRSATGKILRKQLRVTHGGRPQ